MNDRIDEIINTPKTINPEDIDRKCYFVSSINGKPDNDGLSPEKSFQKVSQLFTRKLCVSIPLVKAGDGVFFERGSVFYPEFEINQSGCIRCFIKQGPYIPHMEQGKSHCSQRLLT